MGNPLGVFDDDEISHLTEADKAKLREQIILALKKDEVLSKFLRDNPQIRRALRAQVADAYGRGKLNIKEGS
jgi:hypothetical protein